MLNTDDMKETKICLNCNKQFSPERNTKKYCSDGCKQAAFYKNRNTESAIILNEVTIVNSDLNGNKEHAESHYAPRSADTLSADEIPFNDKISVTRRIKDDDSAADADSRSPKQSLPSKPLNDNSPSRLTVKEPRRSIEPHQEKYVFIRSLLIDEIENYLEDNYKADELFQYPRKYWHSSDLEKAKWITTRLRSVIENLLYLSEQRKIDITLIEMLRDAICQMTTSTNYQYPPSNYPFKNLIKEIQEKLIQLAKEHKGQSEILFSLSRQRKVILIATRFMIADFVPKVKFKELNFKK